jgi:hypothetical protein
MPSILRAILLSLVLGGLSACATRSISDSGYRDPYGYNEANPFYQGELSAFELLGDDGANITDADIAQALAAKQPIALQPGTAIMLVQSGAPLADPEMMAAMRRHYNVSSFTGIPPKPAAATDTGKPAPSYSKLFRLAAARGGFETIIVYWGMLETAREDMVTKVVSWVPFAGSVVPDEQQRMRIRLVAAVIDVRSGRWESYAPEPIEDDSFSNQLNRVSSDQDQVLALKQAGYQALADGLARRYGG